MRTHPGLFSEGGGWLPFYTMLFAFFNSCSGLGKGLGGGGLLGIWGGEGGERLAGGCMGASGKIGLRRGKGRYRQRRRNPHA